MSSTAKTSLQNGQYLISRVLGQGGVGITLKAVHAPSKRLVVIKTLRTKWQKEPEFPSIKQRFQEQVNRFASCQHPGLVRIMDAFEENGLPFAVMDYTAGETLQEVVKKQGPLSEDRAIHYIQQIGSVLTEVHHHNLVHQDITPKNIIRPLNTELVVLTNFGLTDASVLGLSSEKFPPLAGAYAAIEQHQPQFPIAPATDLYALAGTLYFLLTGHEPIAAPRRGDSKLPHPRQYRPQLSSTIETAILQGLALNPQRRPSEVTAWLSSLTHPQNAPVAIESEKPTQPMSIRTSSSKVNSSNLDKKNYSTTPKPSGSRSNASSKGKTLNHSVNISSAIAPKHFPKVVLSTALAAASIGLGVGLMLRIAASSTGPGASFFHSEQSFPVLNNWPGTTTPVNPPSVYSNPERYGAPDNEAPVVPPQPTMPDPYPSAPDVTPLPEQAAEEMAPVPPPASELAPPSEAVPPPSQSIPEPVPAPVEPVAPPPISEPAPPPPSQAPASEGATSETTSNL